MITFEEWFERETVDQIIPAEHLPRLRAAMRVGWYGALLEATDVPREEMIDELIRYGAGS